MSWEKDTKARRTRRWIAQAEGLNEKLAANEEAVHALIDDELEDFEHAAWPDGGPPKPTDHPLFQVALLLEQARGLVDERIEKLQESQT